MIFNEDSRVKIPSILHLTRLGYKYLSLKDTIKDDSTNIFTDIFKGSLIKINKGISESDTDRVFEDIKISLDNEDLGKDFYEKLINQSGVKLIDLSDFDKNSFNVVTELTYKNGDEEFRPDITILINGLPLVFIEVKKPNNQEGILAERNRIIRRFQNKKFRNFINITQIMIFSNNMEYDDNSLYQIEGAYYSTPSYDKPIFNYFREEEIFDYSKILADENDDIENHILKDNNLSIIKHNPEFITNKDPTSPTNRILTSLFFKERLSFILKYAFAYVKVLGGYEKHIMRYPQIFATKALAKKLDQNVRKGIIWHTQGSGKTALAFYNVRYLTDYFQKKGIIPKFYFIVDRIDLLIQAQREFSSRGLIVHTVDSKEEFARDIKKIGVIHNNSGKPEITVVNIHKFQDDSNVVNSIDYDINIQRIYFLDEVHRSYNPNGSFLANLTQSDVNSIKIGLTGTPLLGDDYNSKDLFGEYIHKYYYNSSIIDGYTLRLIREEIETNYKMKLDEVIREIEVLQGEIEKKIVYSHPKFVEPMLDYIITDFENCRITFNDNSIGGMVICDSSEQAKMMYEVFKSKYENDDSTNKIDSKVKRVALILHDIGTKKERKDWIEDFKEGKIDFLFVYNMLLTGFDAKRLKKLYIGRVIKKHNLLQALTRVNRPYKDYKYGFVVDFADIRKEFDDTNEAYFQELQSELGDEIEHYSNLFKSKDEIEEEIKNIKEILFRFDTNNIENFSKQISDIQSKEDVQAIKRALGQAKSLYNLIRLFGHYDILEKLDFNKIFILYREVSNHLDLLNLKDNLEKNSDISNILNVALEDIIFMFTKISEEELVIADELKTSLRITREALADNFDKNDPEFITLKEELERLFKKKNLSEISQDEMNDNIETINKIYAKIKDLNRKNSLLRDKYQNDKKYARIHKRILENKELSFKESMIFEALMGIKERADDQVLNNIKILNNEEYFNKEMIRLVIEEFKNRQKLQLNSDTSKYINNLVVKEYLNEFNGANG